MNTRRDQHPGGTGFFKLLLATVIGVCLTPTALALDPHRDLTDYVRDRWGAEQGFPGRAVYAIAQTPDGYLWLGTEKGLVRFDGLTFRLFSHTDSPAFPAGPILDLLTDAEGTLWIRPQNRNLVRYQNGTFADAIPDLDTLHSGITAMCLGMSGEPLFEVLSSGTYVYRGGKFSNLVSAPEQPNILIISMAQTGDGKIWLGTRDAGLFYLRDGQMIAVPHGLPDKKVNNLLAVGDHELWIGTDNGIVRWEGDEPPKIGAPDKLNHIQARALVRDHESNIWVGTSKGLLRYNSGGVFTFPQSDADAPRVINALFEDREGNLWIGSTKGIERLRATAFMTYPFCKNRTAECNGVGYVDAEGRTWFAPSEGGLYWQKDGETVPVNQDGLDRDVVYALAGRGGELWVGRQRGGLTHLKINGNAVVAETYSQAAGLAQNNIYALHQSRDGTIWAGSIGGGVSRFKDGKFTTYTTADGLASNTITAILEGADGTLWLATANGLSALRQNKWTTYRSVDGLPAGGVTCLLEDRSGRLWIGTNNGLAFLQSGQIHMPALRVQALQEPIMGVAEDQTGGLWISTQTHVLRVDADKLAATEVSEAEVREFGLADGLRSVEGVKRHRAVFRDPQGRIWFSTNLGLSVVDPVQIASGLIPAISQIEGITVDGSAIEVNPDLHISGTHERLTFTYTGLSLTVPERIRFKYRLDGFDQDWSKPVASREAIYTNLAPGSYRFRVLASNSDGLWNGEEATIEFQIQPVFWQTRWFQLAVILALGLAVLGFYRLHLHRLTQELNLRFEERLAERTRIAQELHDTLLQGFISASMQLHVANEHLSADSPAKPLVTRVLALMKQGIDEGRTTLKGLRSSSSHIPDLALAFSRIQEELGYQKPIDYRVTVEGPTQPLLPIIRDEIYRIGREALVNAFRHSRATSIEVILTYGVKQLRILIRDNGCGINPQVLNSGREGHWGLSGMRERAEEIGARLRLWSGSDAGTEVELSIPGHLAFETHPATPPRRWFSIFPLRTARTGVTNNKKSKKKQDSSP